MGNQVEWNLWAVHVPMSKCANNECEGCCCCCCYIFSFSPRILTNNSNIHKSNVLKARVGAYFTESMTSCIWLRDELFRIH